MEAVLAKTTGHLEATLQPRGRQRVRLLPEKHNKEVRDWPGDDLVGQ
jgi:hypothetical protein